MVIKANVQKNSALGVDLKQGGGYVTNENIINALGYTPANEADIPTKVSQLENDEKYVKSWEELPDKPFGEETEEGLIPLFEHETVSSATVPTAGVYHRHTFANNLNLKFTADSNYKLLVNGVEYDVDQIETTGTLRFQNVAIGNTTTRVSITQTSDKTQIVYLTGSYGDYELDVSLYEVGITTVLHKLDNKYLDCVETIEYGNTFTFAGNADENNPIDVGNNTYVYHVSDATPTKEDFDKGWSMVTPVVDQPMIHNIIYGDGYAFQENFAFAVIYEDNVTLYDTVYPKKGIYFMHDEDTVVTESLTLTDYEYKVAKIKEEYLPTEYSPSTSLFETVYSDTITWGGDTDGRDCIIFDAATRFCHVSDSIFTADDLANGGILNMKGLSNEGEPVANTISLQNSIQYLDVSDVIGAEAYALALAGDASIMFVGIVPNDIYNNGQVLYKKGTYFMKSYMDGGVMHISSLTLNNFNKFERKLIKTEYMRTSEVLDVVINLDDLSITPSIGTVVEALSNKRLINAIVTRDGGVYNRPAQCSGIQGDDSVYFETVNVSGNDDNPVTQISRTYIRVQDKVTYKTVTETISS